MAIISEEVYTKINCKNISYYESLGYVIPKKLNNKGKYVFDRSKIININVNDLPLNSAIRVKVKCDNCNCIKEVIYYQYIKCINNNGKYFCNHCALKILNEGKPKKVKNKSFKQWCIENSRQDLLDRWDYDLNINNPSDVCYSSSLQYYFKCPNNKHNSELKQLINIVHGKQRNIDCLACNSFAQWGIDNLGEDFLEKYWDYEKNTVSPWNIAKASNKTIWIKCQDKIYHGSYDTNCWIFYNGGGCPYCSCHRIHIHESLGYICPEVKEIWSDKNKKSPFGYSSNSGKQVWWRCPKGIHDDYLREIKSSHNYNFRCPECQYSQGEKNIENILKMKNIIYIPQKEFDGLIGLKGGLLSYDFYLPEHNLLIEYQGEFHDGTAHQQTNEEFKKQQEHDKRKKEYAQKHNIKLLEIWYWDFDRIEEILHNNLII